MEKNLGSLIDGFSKAVGLVRPGKEEKPLKVAPYLHLLQPHFQETLGVCFHWFSFFFH